jgi:hypothetical protein
MEPLRREWQAVRDQCDQLWPEYKVRRTGAGAVSKWMALFGLRKSVALLGQDMGATPGLVAVGFLHDDVRWSDDNAGGHLVIAKGLTFAGLVAPAAERYHSISIGV